MARTAAQAGSRERMLEAAIDLLRAAGLTGAGINEIVRASGAPKGSVYHFFPQGKLQIAAEALQLYTELMQQFFEAAMARAEGPAEKLEALFEAMARRVEETQFGRSCAVAAVSLDLDGDAEALRPVLAHALAQWTTSVAAQLGPGAEMRSLAGLVIMAIEGAHVRARAEQSGRPFREAGAWMSRLARGLVRQSN